MKITEKTLAEKVEAIIGNGTPYRSIADAAGCNVSTIYRIKDGLIQNPSYAVGKAIDHLYGEIQHSRSTAA